MKIKNLVVSIALFILLLNNVSATGGGCPWWASQTWLYTDIQIDGNYSSPQNIPTGEDFNLGVWVENVGGWWTNAYNVVVKIENVPEDWTIEINPWNVGMLYGGQGKFKNIEITKGPTNAEIYANASACNANPTISNKISIPIFLVTISGILLVGGYITFRHYKKG